jgi:hypothetical protein
MTTTSKWSLISQSVVMIRIDVHLAGEEPDQHVVRVAPWDSRTTTFRKVHTKSKSGLCYRDEIPVPSDRLAPPSSWVTSFSLHKPPRCREGWFNNVVTTLLDLQVPIKPDMRSV